MKPDENLIEFLSNNMCIDTDKLIEKLNEKNIIPYTDTLIRAIGDFRKALKNEYPEDKIQDIFIIYESLISDKDAYRVLDTLRHVFDGYAYNGLHQVFTRQENEGWYPKITLSRELLPNDIENLANEITIYRGCSASEYATKTYGQSWSTSKEIAELFAYSHYNSQPWFNVNERIVIKAKICKSAILYSDQRVEFEVVIDTKYLAEVELHQRPSTSK